MSLKRWLKKHRQNLRAAKVCPEIRREILGYYQWRLVRYGIVVFYFPLFVMTGVIALATLAFEKISAVLFLVVGSLFDLSGGGYAERRARSHREQAHKIMPPAAVRERLAAAGYKQEAVHRGIICPKSDVSS